jgi:hypothetical protein
MSWKMLPGGLINLQFCFQFMVHEPSMYIPCGTVCLLDSTWPDVGPNPFLDQHTKSQHDQRLPTKLTLENLFHVFMIQMR